MKSLFRILRRWLSIVILRTVYGVLHFGSERRVSRYDDVLSLLRFGAVGIDGRYVFFFAAVSVPCVFQLRQEEKQTGQIFKYRYSPQLTITITGEKKSGSSDSGYDMIGYKLYDSAGYLVDSGNIYLSSLSAGDKFKDDSVVIYDITPGESYTFQLSEYSW